MQTAPHRYRYAPTPSRPLHVGNGIAALIGWAAARADAGRFVLRVEDIDRGRCRPEYEAQALEDLRWLGLDWDEGPDVGGPFAPYRQSERLARYDAVLVDLLARGLAYACVCSRAEVRAAQSAPHTHVAGELPYPGTCRPAPPGVAHKLRPDRGGVRFDVHRLGDDAVQSWLDGALGPQREDVRETCGDFLLGRPDQPSYQLAVVVDDDDMRITHVVRGRDLAGSTARQRLLHAAISDRPPPRVFHHALIVDGDGDKLSKRDASLALATLRDDGVDPAALRAHLGRTIGLLPASVERASPADFVDALGAMAASGRAMRDGVLPPIPGATAR